MQCPNPACGPSHPNLLMTHREGVEIDYCPHCRGVWLDRGELDKLIALAAKPETSFERSDERERAAPSYRPENVRHEPYRPDSSRRDGRYEQDHSYKHSHAYSHKRKSWLGDMFDFD